MQVSSVLTAWLAALTTVQHINARTAVQYKEDRMRKLDDDYKSRVKGIENRLERLENSIMISLERSQIASEHLEHKMNVIWAEAQKGFQAFGKRCCSNTKAEVNTTSDMLARDSLALVNATRRELAEAARYITRRMSDSNNRLEKRLAKVAANQEVFLDSCQRIQRDTISNDAQLDKILIQLIDAFKEKTETMITKLNTNEALVRSHDSKVMKSLQKAPTQIDSAVSAFGHKIEPLLSKSCPGLDEIQSLSEKLVELTERADRTLLSLQERMHKFLIFHQLASSWPTEESSKEISKDGDLPEAPIEKGNKVAGEADKLINIFKSIEGDPDPEDEDCDEEDYENENEGE